MSEATRDFGVKLPDALWLYRLLLKSPNQFVRPARIEKAIQTYVPGMSSQESADYAKILLAELMENHLIHTTPDKLPQARGYPTTEKWYRANTTKEMMKGLVADG